MDYSIIHGQIEQLNLKWQEYDFGDTLYAEIPSIMFSKKTKIVRNCKTEKYRIRFQDNGYVLAFKEKEEEGVSVFARIFQLVGEINLSLSKKEQNVYQSEEFIDP